MIWIQQHAELLFCLVGCMLVTVIPRVGPVMYLHAESLPDLLRHWLSFVPVAVWRPCWARTSSSIRGSSCPRITTSS